MKKHIDEILQRAGQHKVLIQNFSYLSALQFFNLLIPLITYPYLIRVLGKETYGLVVYAQAIVGYLVILVGFGFNISATKEISVHRGDKSKLSEIVSSVLVIKAVLFAISAFILIVLLFIIPQARGYKGLFILMLWMCLYDVIFPVWYFQGIEQMKYITYITLISRLIFLGLIFVLIHSSSDYLFIPIINGIGALMAGIISLTVIFNSHKVRFKFQSLQTLKFYFKDSIPIFVSNASIKLYTSTNKVIIGSFLGMADVAYYDLAEKLVTVLKMPMSILSQSLFPKISKEKNLSFVKKVFKISLTANVLFYIVFIISSKYLILFLGSKTMLDSVLIVNLLAFTLPVIAMSNIFGVQLLLPFGYNKTFSRIIVSSSIFYLIQAITFWISFGFTLINVTLMTVFTEIFVTITMFYYCNKYRLWG